MSNRWYFIFFFWLFSVTVINGQNVLDFKVDDVTIEEAINTLGERTHLNLTFNAQDPRLSDVISYSARGKTPMEILTDLLSPVELSFQLIGNQIVIYHGPVDEKLVTTTSIPVIPLPAQSEIILDPPLSKPQTKQLDVSIDTLIIRDTIILTDTIRRVDTVFVDKLSTAEPSSEIVLLPEDIFDENRFRSPSWGSDLTMSMMASDFTTVGGVNNMSFRNFSIDGRIFRQQKRFSFALGLQFSQYAQLFTHQYEISSGGYYVVDTLDTYYTIAGSDTSWFHVLDSSYLPLDSKQYSMDRNNRLAYLSLTGEVLYIILHRPAFDLSLRAGAQLSSVIYERGLYLADAGMPDGTDLNNINFTTPAIAWLGGMNLVVRMTSNLSFRGDLYYLHYNQPVSGGETPIGAIHAYGCSLGIRYYFSH